MLQDEVEKKCEFHVEENRIQQSEYLKKHEEEIRHYSNDQVRNRPNFKII